MKILAFCEQRDSKFKKASFETASTAVKLAGEFNGEAAAVVIGNNVAELTSGLGAYGIKRAIVYSDSSLNNYMPSAYATVISEIAKRENAEIVLFSATAMGKDLAPRVAVRLNAGLATDCISLKVEGGDVIATRPIYAGKVLVDLKIQSAVKVFSLRPNVFPTVQSDSVNCNVESAAVEFADKDFETKVVEINQTVGKLDVAEADIIVTGGRGMKGPEHFTIIEELAGLLGGAVGASRAVVDAGWRPHSEQVGQTGKTVSPTLYFAVGVSGAIQHLAGMSSSKYIVAINKDKEAPIFQVADYGIVGDAFEVLPAVTREVKKLLGI